MHLPRRFAQRADDRRSPFVGARGFEPLTSSVSGKRSPPELSARHPIIGGGGRRLQMTDQGRRGQAFAEVMPQTERTCAERRLPAEPFVTWAEAPALTASFSRGVSSNTDR